MTPSEIVVGGRYTDGAGVVLEVVSEKPISCGRYLTCYMLTGEKAGTFQGSLDARIAAWAKERLA